jgi:hypothetical protein
VAEGPQMSSRTSSHQPCFAALRVYMNTLCNATSRSALLQITKSFKRCDALAKCIAPCLHQPPAHAFIQVSGNDLADKEHVIARLQFAMELAFQVVHVSFHKCLYYNLEKKTMQA